MNLLFVGLLLVGLFREFYIGVNLLVGLKVYRLCIQSLEYLRLFFALSIKYILLLQGEVYGKFKL